MKSKYSVRLNDSERKELKELVRSLQGSMQKLRRANILLAVDLDGLKWSDSQAAEAYHCSRHTVENVRRRFATEGFKSALNGKIPGNAGRPKRIIGSEEAAIIALRLGEAPEGYSNWTLRLLAEKAVELEIVESISHEHVRRTLKKQLHST